MKNILSLTLILISAFGWTQTTTTHTLTFQDSVRDYRLYVPASYDGSEAVPLLFNLHGYTSNNNAQEVYGDFRGIADTANFILIHPNGTFDENGDRWWNSYQVFGAVDDVAFLSHLIDVIDADYNINLDRVYSTGMSNGGFMSFELACASSRFTAVASVTGSMTSNRPSTCNPARTTPAMQIHGTADNVVPYAGNAYFAPVENVVDFWVNHVNADPTPVVTNLPELDPNDPTSTEWFVYENGDKNATVEHFKVTNGGHTWPGSAFNIGVTSQDFDASVEIWRFFSQYDAATLSTSSLTIDDFEVSVFPNPSQDGKIKIKSDYALDAIKVTDVLGKSILEKTPKTNSFELELKDRGVYFISISTKAKQITKRVVVQ